MLGKILQFRQPCRQLVTYLTAPPHSGHLPQQDTSSPVSPASSSFLLPSIKTQRSNPRSKREIFRDLAPLLWHSFGTIAALLQDDPGTRRWLQQLLHNVTGGSMGGNMGAAPQPGMDHMMRM